MINGDAHKIGKNTFKAIPKPIPYKNNAYLFIYNLSIFSEIQSAYFINNINNGGPNKKKKINNIKNSCIS